jgi:hypothetical protein
VGWVLGGLGLFVIIGLIVKARLGRKQQAAQAS